MGADKLEKRKTVATPTILLVLIGAAAILTVVVAFLPKIFAEGESEVPKLKPQEEAKLEKRLKEIDDSEQYALVATIDGWYSCLHSGRATYYLLAGEVWKYGVTSKGEFGRYAASFLVKNKVSYIVEFKGNIAECLKMEQIKLFSYPYLLENLARTKEERLPRPPYNPIMR